jgi:two-component system, cell cycle sensor histidine kinase and response regulator CckA
VKIRISVRKSLLDSLNAEGKKTILLVEDEPDIRALTRRYLEARGYHVLEAKDANHALFLGDPRENTVHLLLTDVVMPEMDGRDLAERLKCSNQSMKILFISAYDCDIETMSEFVQKPCDLDVVARKIGELLSLRNDH